MRRLLAVLLCVIGLLGGCAKEETPLPIEAVGKWTCAELSEYYFELDEDGSCIMFSKDGEWLSAGTYTVQTDQLAFDMDTGSFTWVRSEEDGVLLYEIGGKTYHYRLQK